MPPIRVALIGLSQSAKTSWASQAHLPYLLSAHGNERFQIIALLNSSVKAAEAAIQYYQLPPGTKAYGSPEDLAKDPDVDLVVCTTRVDVHYDTIRPSVDAGKDVFVEWPLAENAVRAGDLAELAKQRGGQTIVGLQARVSPAVVKLREIVQSGQLGKVLSSSVQAFAPWAPRDRLNTPGLLYFLDKKVGGNPITIAFGHMLDPVHAVLGEYETSSARVQIQRPEQLVAIENKKDFWQEYSKKDVSNGHKEETGKQQVHISDVPDLVSVHGALKASSVVADEATLVVNFRRGAPFPGTTPYIWTINCEKGEIRISSENGPSLHSNGSEHDFPIEIHDYSTDEVHQVEWSFEDWRLALPSRARNIAKLYELYANGELATASGADFELALHRHKQLDEMLYPQ